MHRLSGVHSISIRTVTLQLTFTYLPLSFLAELYLPLIPYCIMFYDMIIHAPNGFCWSASLPIHLTYRHITTSHPMCLIIPIFCHIFFYPFTSPFPPHHIISSLSLFLSLPPTSSHLFSSFSPFSFALSYHLPLPLTEHPISCHGEEGHLLEQK